MMMWFGTRGGFDESLESTHSSPESSGCLLIQEEHECSLQVLLNQDNKVESPGPMYSHAVDYFLLVASLLVPSSSLY